MADDNPTVVPIERPELPIEDLHEKLDAVISALSHYAEDHDNATLNGCVLILADIQRELAVGFG